MTTQRDRLAAVLHDVCCEGYERDAGPHDSVDNVYADALLARGVRVVDAETLAAAFAKAGVTLYDFGKWEELDSRTDAETILAALDAEP